MYARSPVSDVGSAPHGGGAVAPSISAAPAPPRKEHEHAPGLDGIRGVAVAAIVAYHLGLMDGGLLSVSVFFTLSGYLITSILLSGWRRRGGIDLKVFWIRRARRLLPALLALLAVVLSATAIAAPSKLAAYGRQAFAALIYMANWATIARGDTYFNRFSGPGPFDHLWSLAIEEQFYAVWPLLLLGLLVVGKRLFGAKGVANESRRAPVLAIVVTGMLAVASALMMAIRYVPNAINNTRAYEGTDGRAAPILIGAIAAMLLPLSDIGQGGRARRIALDLLGVAGTLVAVLVVVGTDEASPFLYRGGESLVSIASAAIILGAGHPDTIVGKAFGAAPFRWLGVRTYGVYLWHLPVIAFMPASLLEGRTLARAAIQLALILGLAALSWTLLEDPIRRNGLVATFARDARHTVVRRWAGVMVLVLVATGALGAGPLLSHSSAAENDIEATIAELEKEAPDPRPRELTAAAPAASETPSGQGSVVEVPAKEPLRSSCIQLVHVGDSTSLGLMSAKYIPNADDRLDARYGAVGVRFFVPEISGGRSIVEKFKDHANAWEIVAGKAGYKGCWVFALGIGDAANIKGNLPGLSGRIDSMMTAAAGTPVLWTNVKTLLDKGPYQQSYMESWNLALLQACARHPNMRVFDWASEVQDDWYLDDKIHPNDLGSKERAARLAMALAVAFPKDAPSPAGCVVRSTL